MLVDPLVASNSAEQPSPAAPKSAMRSKDKESLSNLERSGDSSELVGCRGA